MSSTLRLYRDNGKEHGDYKSMDLGFKETTIVDGGLYRDNGKEDGKYYSILGLYWVFGYPKY